MFRFCASLGTLFLETGLPGRFAAARAHGFDAVELTLPYDYPAAVLAKARVDSATQVVLFTAPLGNFMSGGEGIAAVPTEQAAFRDSVAQALEYAQALDAHYVQFVAGRCAGGCHDLQRRDTYLKTYVENLHFALEAFAPTSTRILLEAINSRDFPDFLVSTPAQMRVVSSYFEEGEMAAIFDTVHLAAMAVNPVTEWREHASSYAHVQLADAPQRSVPGTGSVDFTALFHELALSGYRGYLGAEYWFAPGVDSAASDAFAWIDQARDVWKNTPR